MPEPETPPAGRARAAAAQAIPATRDTAATRAAAIPVDPAQASQPVVSKPYVMPDDPEEGSVEALTKEVAECSTS